MIVLAAASTARPAGIAAVYALLSGVQPRRALLAYLLAGFAFSVAFGVVVVTVFGGIHAPGRMSTRSAVIDLLVGVALLGFAAGMWRGRGRAVTRGDGGRGDVWRARLKDPSLKTAAWAGVLTHLPGLFYLAGLNAIVSQRASQVENIAQVVIFNAIWFSTAIAAFVAFLLRPEQTRAAVAGARSWIAARERLLVVLVTGAVGAYLCASGAARLAGWG